MKIIFINRYFYPDHSATSQILTDLAFFLADQGLDVHVITSRQCYDDPNARLDSIETINRVRIHRVWTSRFGRSRLAGRALDYLSFYLSTGWCLLRLLRRGDVIVAKTDPPLLSVVASWAARLRGAQLLNWLQDLFPEVATGLKVRGMTGTLSRLLCALRNASLQRATKNVVIGERMAQRLKAEGIPDDKISVIQNWADGTAIRPIEVSDNALRREWGLEDQFVIGYSGNMGRAHEFETLLNAMEQLCGSHPSPLPSHISPPLPSPTFLFIGGGHHRQALQTETQHRHLNNIQFQPYQPRERLQESLGVADVHLISLRPELEGLIVPSKFYGIAAAGRPAIYIGDPDGEIARIIKQADCGVVIEPGDDAGLIQTILRYRDDPALVMQHGANARTVFDQNFDKSIALHAWYELLKRGQTKNYKGVLT
ncbi:MAG: glycosyltransferase family 4 protein [Candidatus Competibacteraceae bacterium]|nr:glycosyltransferase family 4 protein [Candidatus Competibacteraceae bacterium]